MVEPQSEQSDQVTRRGFVGWAAGLGIGFMTLVVGIPVLGSVAKGAGAAKPAEYVRIADVSAIPTGEPYGISFVETTQDAYLYAQVPHSVYALKKSETDVTVYSPTCPHLGCQVFFDRQKKEYVCPCHGSVFTEEGAYVSGPAPRGLDVLPSKIDKGGLYVQWVVYKPGTPLKIPV
jgi:menaquinol-cytochrome c reductase iron-sulfur subunit